MPVFISLDLGGCRAWIARAGADSRGRYAGEKGRHGHAQRRGRRRGRKGRNVLGATVKHQKRDKLGVRIARRGARACVEGRELAHRSTVPTRRKQKGQAAFAFGSNMHWVRVSAQESYDVRAGTGTEDVMENKLQNGAIAVSSPSLLIAAEPVQDLAPHGRPSSQSHSGLRVSSRSSGEVVLPKNRRGSAHALLIGENTAVPSWIRDIICTAHARIRANRCECEANYAAREREAIYHGCVTDVTAHCGAVAIGNAAGGVRKQAIRKRRQHARTQEEKEQSVMDEAGHLGGSKPRHEAGDAR
ncbi:hypothetical protein DFH09DRAFT_1082190 [Mycena vulgaris]|nr:hypothetical protein DFH09DRAFT_1082190 [Mycena vulgaris]